MCTVGKAFFCSSTVNMRPIDRAVTVSKFGIFECGLCRTEPEISTHNVRRSYGPIVMTNCAPSANLINFKSKKWFWREFLTDTGEFVQKWTRVFSTRRWVILVARTRRKKEENSVSTFGRFRLWTSFESSPVSVNYKFLPSIHHYFDSTFSKIAPRFQTEKQIFRLSTMTK